MREAGRIVAEVLPRSGSSGSGLTTADLEAIANRIIVGSTAPFLIQGVPGFPGMVCASVNEEIVHGIPGSGCCTKGTS